MSSPRATTRSGRPIAPLVVRAIVGMIGLLAAAAFAPSTASATTTLPEPIPNTLVNSSPENGAVLQVSPDAIVIGFAEEIGSQSSISVSCEAEPIPLPDAEVIEDTTLQVEIATPLPAGTCVALYRSTDADGQETSSGNITFIVQNDTVTTIAEGGDTAPETATTVPVTTPVVADDTDEDELTVVDFSVAGRGDAPLWLFRLISTLGIATLFGSLLLITAAWPEGVEYLVTIRFLRVVWIVAAIGTFVFMGLAGAAVTPDGGAGPFSPSAWGDLLDAGWAGSAVLLRMVLVLASAWVAFRPDRAIDPTAQLLALGIPGLAAATIGLSRTIGDFALIGALVGVAHALAMSVWVGGVILLARVVLAGPGDEDLVHAVRGFGRVSTPAILITIITGLIQMIRLDGNELFDSGHGRIVVLKAFVVAVMIFVAFSARQFVAQRMNRAQHMSVPLADRLRRAFGAEAAFGFGTLVLSSWLLGWIPPNIDATPPIEYAQSQEHSDPSETLDVRIRVTDDRVGTVGLEVLLRDPIEGLQGLNVIFEAPAASTTIGGIRQPVPLTEPGFAVRAEEVGLPLDTAGPWIVTVEARLPTGTLSSTPQTLEIFNADGTEAITVVTPAPLEVVEVPITDG